MADTSVTRREPGRLAVWFGLFGGLAAWVLHLAIGFVLVFDGCALGLANVRLLVGAATLVLGLLALGATLAAYRTWRERASDPAGERRRFMAYLGLWMSGLALLIIVLLAVPALWLEPC